MAIFTLQACWAVHHLARETEGKSRMVKENVHTIICDILSNPVSHYLLYIPPFGEQLFAIFLSNLAIHCLYFVVFGGSFLLYCVQSAENQCQNTEP